MKTSKLLPKLTAPIQRLGYAAGHKTPNLGISLSHCDLATRQCFETPYPFAGDDAE
jgi:prenylated cyclic peptide (anacyclamide/piricyclamide family)